MTEAIKMAQTQTWDFESNKAYTKFKYSINDIIQTLKQPKTPKWFIAEMELCNNCINHQGQHLSSDCCHNYKLKTTTNSEGKEVLVGEYIYE